MPSFQITNRIKQDVRNARMIGEFTVKVGAQKLPGILWGLVSKARNSVYPVSEPRVRPEENELVNVASPVSVTSAPHVAEPCEGYDLLTGTQIVELLQSVSETEARNIHEYECTHRNRALVMSAAQSRFAVQ